MESEEENPAPPKRMKTSESVRKARIDYLQETVSDIHKQIIYKNQRIEQEKTQFALCEQIAQQLKKLKQDKFKVETELKALHRKQQQNEWYKKVRKYLSLPTISENECISQFCHPIST